MEAQQLYGCNGYCVEWGAEQYERDARIAMIYEGTNGIQAMDLVGRKLFRNAGAHVSRFVAVVCQDLGSRAPQGLEDFHEACLCELARLEAIQQSVGDGNEELSLGIGIHLDQRR